MEKKLTRQLKRKLITSIIFDIGTTEHASKIPHVSVSWELNQKNPFLMIIKIGLKSFEYRFAYNKKVMYSKSLVDIAKEQIKLNFSYYSGLLDYDIVNDYYLSDFGKCVFSSNKKSQVDKWMLQFKY